ncbi:MoaD/ThiS family protein [Egibacter rhizosphaerae]|uniref:MoaD/ThiS family protein n=1 Tax=Egibacter rhizosphaerae TaxID=1670831 RepID=A0A411YC57_9ACTN|nr:ubiquitin-like small modifier protein 1 [Egibacter rhizosphaerae]QBI18742.1 MoaD/ThiS family protein [Egibacter rhizosphaerae]
MTVEVRVPTVLRQHTGGESKVAAEGATLREAIDDLEARHGGIKERLVSEQGDLHRFINLYVNDEDVRFLSGIDTPLDEGDSIAILPAVAGGHR